MTTIDQLLLKVSPVKIYAIKCADPLNTVKVRIDFETESFEGITVEQSATKALEYLRLKAYTKNRHSLYDE